jgi:myosin light chain 6
MAPQFTVDKIVQFQEAFLLFDQRGDGKIPVSQIGEVVRALGQNPTESDVKKLVVEHLTEDRVTFEVFLPIMQVSPVHLSVLTSSLQTICSRRSTDTCDDFVEGLRHFDKDGNGFISSAELRHHLTTLGEKLSDEEAEKLLAGQEDNMGNINYDNFVRTVMNG